MCPKVNNEPRSGCSTELDKPKKPWAYMDEVLAALKTAFPLLALSMEFMVDQINKHFKCHPDEDAHRLIVALLNDGLSYVGRQPNTYPRIPSSTSRLLPARIHHTLHMATVRVNPGIFLPTST